MRLMGVTSTLATRLSPFFVILFGLVLLGAQAVPGAQTEPPWISITDQLAKVLTALAAFGAVIGGVVAYRQYKIQRENAAIQNQIALAASFSDLLGRADGRVTTVASETAIGNLFETDLIKNQVDPAKIREILEGAGTLGIGVGDAAQAAAIECVAFFGCQYPMLNRAAREGLAYVLKYSPSHSKQTQDAIDRLETAWRNGA